MRHDSAQPAHRRPTGRRTGDSGTRDAILDSALALFAERGYEGTSFRAIARQAGVDPGLIRYFFGDKETLFATVVADRTTIPERLAAALAGEPQDIGHRVADDYLRMWEEAQTRPMLLALIRSATTSQSAAKMLRETLGARVDEAAGIAPHDPRMQGIELAASLMLGSAIARHVIKVPAIADMDHDALVDQLAPTVQRFLVGTSDSLSETGPR